MSLYISESEIPRNDLIKMIETSFHNKFNVPAASSCKKKGNKISSNYSNTSKNDITINQNNNKIFVLKFYICKITNNEDYVLRIGWIDRNYWFPRTSGKHHY